MFRKPLYIPLHTKKRQIRLRKVHTSQPAFSKLESVQCSLEIVSLDDAVYYDALSYAWGDTTTRVPITVNAHKCQVTMSLFEAFSALRDKAAVENYLWADALCINQSDLEERSQQVRMMGDIYRSARLVHVWLGQEGDNTRHAFNYLYDAFEGGRTEYLLLMDDSIAEGLDDLAFRPWSVFFCIDLRRSLTITPSTIRFTMLWVVQEVTVSRNATLFHYGSAPIPFLHFTISLQGIIQELMNN